SRYTSVSRRLHSAPVKRASALGSRDLRGLLAVTVIILPLAAGGPGYLRSEVRNANRHQSVFAPPPSIHYNQALTRGVMKHVPSHASVAAVGTSLAQGWTRWVAYLIAPRQLTDGTAQWTMVFGETPQQAHLGPVHFWRYG